MVPKINMTRFAGKKLLLAPMDWGLGHATRCIPLVKALLEKGCRVSLAGEGLQRALLREEFPDLPFLELTGYRVRYSSISLMGKILFQVPKILKSIKAENRWLAGVINKQGFDIIISDNRYGLYNKNAYCIFITHQLNIKTNMGKWSERVLNHWNYQFINHFNECWVPDEEGEDNLAGDLSHPVKMPSIPVKYTGPLSRFEQNTSPVIKNHLLVLLSGPEPQRTLFENKIIDDIVYFNGTATVVRGLPTALNIIPSTNSIRFYNHLPTDELQNEIEKAEWVIARCGYSTVMDMAVMQKKSILIPTPGQTEQEYLAGYLMKKKFAFCMKQKEFSLKKAMEKAVSN